MIFFALWLGSFGLAAAFNNPPGVDIWCGKAYRSTNASFEPGGWLVQPVPSLEPLLDLRIRPRMSLYTEDEQWGSFIIDTALSHLNGYPYYDSGDSENGDDVYESSKVLYVDISLASNNADLVSSAIIPVNTTSNEVSFSLAYTPAQLDPYDILLQAISPDGNKSYTARTQLYRLPNRTDGGSIAKLDSLYGGLLVRNEQTEWQSILPYSFYVSWGGWLEKSIDNVQHFKDQGYNIVHIVPGGGQTPFNFTELNIFLDKCDEIGLWLMYDMRWTYQNATAVEEQVDMLKSRKSMLLWYTGDEPDGNSDPTNATRIAYDQIKSLDPWHPVSLCLNCYNFYYQEYSSGADIILEDVYPIAVNTSYSEVYGTVCNTTYGCCGCDDCNGNLEDISDRLDIFAQYQEWIGGPPKTFWGVSQAFGNESFWRRYPTPEEEVTMNMLSINHNAKGIVMWVYPTSSGLSNVTSKFSKILLRKDVTSHLLGSHTTALEVAGQGRIDAAGWTVGKQTFVSILYLGDSDLQSEVTVTLPTKASSVSEVLWGPGGWSVSDGKLVKNGLTGLETTLLMVTLE